MRNKRGITLAALVITIVILFILASITIGFFTGDSGVIDKAAKGKKDTALAKAAEDIESVISSTLARGGGEAKYDILIEELNKMFKENGYSISPRLADADAWTITIATGYGDVSKIVTARPDAIPVADPDVWGPILANAQKHPDQVVSNDIGIDVNENSVNLDLWYYSIYRNKATLIGSDGNYTQRCYIPYTVESYDEYFRDIGSLDASQIEYHNLVLPQYIKEEGSNEYAPVTELGRCSFYECTDLYSVVIPSTMQEIGDYAFYGCNGLDYVTFKSGMNVQVGDRAFGECLDSNLTFEFQKNVKADFNYQEYSSNYGYNSTYYIYLDRLILSDPINISGNMDCIKAKKVYLNGSEIVDAFYNDCSIFNSFIDTDYLNLKIYIDKNLCDDSKDVLKNPYGNTSDLGCYYNYGASYFTRVQDQGNYAVYEMNFEEEDIR